MPIFHFEYIGEGQTPNGKTVKLPPPAVLMVEGPFIGVTISIADSFSQQLIQQGKPIPPPETGRAILDTGASGTCIDDSIAQKMGLPVIDRGNMGSTSHQSTPCNIYPILLVVQGTQIRINVARAMGANLSSFGIIALIGRDFLQHCTLFYNGIRGQVTLSL